MSNNQLEERFISYGIVQNADEMKDFIVGATKTAEIFLEDEKEACQGFGNSLFNTDIGIKLYDEFVERFTLGFCEGTVFHTISTVSRLIELEFSDEEIIKITGITEKRLASIKHAIIRNHS